MSMPRILAASVLAFALAASAASAQDGGLGKPLTESDIKQWDIAVLPDGTNLPPGSGMPTQGAKIFAEKCSACHGDAAKVSRPIGRHLSEDNLSPTASIR
jgi:S-disulfanyl-L-cysteine oxidoreductase SoxD